MNPLNNFTNILDNFWELNPQFKVPFKSIISVKESSKLMWGISFILEEDSIYNDIPEKDRVDFVLKEFNIKPPKNFIELLDKYAELRLSYIQRKLNNWKNKLDERDAFIANSSYDAKNYEMLDKMMSNTDKMYKQYFAIVAELQKENSTRNLGGKEVSLSDKGEI